MPYRKSGHSRTRHIADEKRLDLLSCNFADNLLSSHTLPPLESDSCPSDHDILVAKFKIPLRHIFKMITYKTRKRTKVAKEKFKQH